MYLLKKEYPYNYNENKHKIHLSDREINTIRTVIVATFLAIKWIQHVVFLHKQFASIIVMFFSLTVVVLFNRLHRVYAVWFQISDFAFYNELTFSTKTFTIAQFFNFVAEEKKKKDDKKQRHFMTGLPQVSQ